jgi:hypothetical protein
VTPILMGLPGIADRLAGVVRRGACPTGVAMVGPDRRRFARRGCRVLGAAAAALTLAGCSTVTGWFADDDGPPTEEISVFDIAIGQCFTAQQEVQQELSSLDAVPCNGPHWQEAFAVIDYQPPTGVEGDAFPGDAALAGYADATCAQEFERYVGISYLDSSLFFTYLLPSARGWEQSDDRSVICFVTTTGPELTTSAKESRV